ncbi:NACHT domain-containing protein [Kitasatospora sp. NPDC048239]|uniref:NACHT domain-containing protein n=1 Tax=Kitasatospora sp. NPDC048239 TaxID=3364046 RepID=UPI003710B5E5
MPGGRPPKGGQERYEELEALAAWFQQALLGTGYRSPNAFVQAGLFDKGLVYGVHNAARLFPLAAMRALALALDRDPAEVEPVWRRAKQALELAAAAQRAAGSPRLESWDRLPQPGPVLGNLLEAQAAVVDRLPYDILDVAEPPLSAIYVRQQVRAQSVREPGEGDKEARGGSAGGSAGGLGTAAQEGGAGGAKSPDWDAVLPASEVLDRHVHLLVTGEPGAGKSTLANHLTWLLARIWLREESTAAAPTAEPLVPLRIAARTLVGEGGSWSAALCGAARRSLGHSLVADPEPGLFTGRVQGARWLVLVDGLDEVTDRQERAGIIRTVAQHARADSAYRFLVTTRPLPEAELAPLRGAGFAGYRMEPFDEAELRDFATQWFRAQVEDEEDAAAAVARFVEEAADGRLRELVRNPLLATIAAIGATLEPTRALPSNRLSLYRRFFEYLLRRGDGAAEWHEELLEALGRYRIEQDGSLGAAARDWLKGRAVLSDRELRDLLLGSGLLVAQADDFRFLHQSFAEFLAARSYAAQVPADFPNLAEWVRRATSEAEQTLALFTFRLWAEREGCEGDLIIDHLLDGVRTDQYVLAALLVAEGVVVGPDRRARLVERLVECGRCDPDDVEEAIRALADVSGDPAAVERLRQLAGSVGLPIGLRLEAVAALARCLPAAEAEELLRSLLPDVKGLLPRAARISRTISSAARRAVRQHADRIDRSWSAAWVQAFTAQTLEILGETASVAELCRGVLADPLALPDIRETAVEAWLRAEPSDAPGEIALLALGMPGRYGAAAIKTAAVLERLGEAAAAARVTGGLLDSAALDGYHLWQVAELWAKAPGPDGAAPLVRAVDRVASADGFTSWYTTALLKAAAELGENRMVAEWARAHAAADRMQPVAASRVIALLLAAEGPGASTEVLAMFDQGERVGPFDRATCAQELLQGGSPQAARVFAERALRTPNGSAGFYEDAVTVLLKVSAADALAFLEGESTSARAHHPTWIAGVLEGLAAQEGDLHHDLARELALRQRDSPEAEGKQVLDAVTALIAVDGRSRVEQAVETVVSHPKVGVGSMLDLARGLASIGERAAARRIWWNVLEHAMPPNSYEWRLLQDIQNADAIPDAVARMTELVEAGSTAPAKRLRLRQMRAWLQVAAEA